MTLLEIFVGTYLHNKTHFSKSFRYAVSLQLAFNDIINKLRMCFNSKRFDYISLKRANTKEMYKIMFPYMECSLKICDSKFNDESHTVRTIIPVDVNKISKKMQ